MATEILIMTYIDKLMEDLEAGAITLEQFNALSGVDDELDALTNAAQKGWMD